MESTKLASGEDAELILRLYEIRREPAMRAARQWLTVEFWPDSAQEVFFVLNEFGSQHNQYLRQVISYWEMAASFVLRGALDGDMFLECNAENTFILAKFHPFLAEIRTQRPDFLTRTEQVMQRFAGARANLERVIRSLESRPERLAVQSAT